MTIDDVMSWISKKSVELWQSMQSNVTNDESWNKFKGSYDILEELRMHILMKTNPHNREDIKKYNEKMETQND
jgi:hypothetical protein